MRTVINAECIDQDLIIMNAPVIASGGEHENFIEFNFCSKWDGHLKTAVFYRNIKDVYYSVLDENDVCEIPHEVTDTEGTMFFGVFGVLDDIRRTSKVVKYKIKNGVISADMKPSEPSVDIYMQILSGYNNHLTRIDNLEDKAIDLEAGVNTATNIAKGRNQAHVFETTAAMEAWLSSEECVGQCQVGDNLYIKEAEVPDWWIAEVLEGTDAETGFYYKISKLEVQKVDLSEIETEITNLKKYVGDSKTVVANAVTAKNVPTATDASFETIAENIGKIKAGSGNAQPENVDEGVTFTNDNGTELTGTSTAKADYAKYKDAVVDGLEFSGLGVTDETDADTLKGVLLGRFPQTVTVFPFSETDITKFDKYNQLYPTGVNLVSQVGSSYAIAELTVTSDKISIAWDGNHNGSVVSNKMVDVTNFKSIRVNGYIKSSNDSTNPNDVIKGVLYKTTNAGEDTNAIVFDLNTDFSLEGYSGEYYIGIFGSIYNNVITWAYVTSIVLSLASGGTGDSGGSYSDGYAQSEADFWNSVQDYGNRTDYQSGFRQWNCEYIRPKHKIIPTANCAYMFSYNDSLKVIESEYFDLSHATYNPSTNSSTTNALCTNCGELVEFQDIGLQAGYYNTTWSNCRKLKTIHKLRSTKDCKWTNAFQNCSDLEEILNIDGFIGQNGFDVSKSTKLSRETLIRIFEHLYDYSTEGGTHTITIGTANQDKVLAEIESIARPKGWTVA